MLTSKDQRFRVDVQRSRPRWPPCGVASILHCSASCTFQAMLSAALLQRSLQNTAETCSDLQCAIAIWQAGASTACCAEMPQPIDTHGGQTCTTGDALQRKAHHTPPTITLCAFTLHGRSVNTSPVDLSLMRLRPAHNISIHQIVYGEQPRSFVLQDMRQNMAGIGLSSS